MKCIKCRENNINQANYCKNCGYHFSEAEQKAAKKWTLVWYLEAFDKLKSLKNFSFITDSNIFKIISVIFVLAIGIYSWVSNGIDLRLLENDNYSIQYNTKLSEYYLLVEEDTTYLDLFVPNRTDELKVKHLDKNDELIDEKVYDEKEKIVLMSTSGEDYYLIEARYNEDDIDSLKLFVYRVEEKEQN